MLCTPFAVLSFPERLVQEENQHQILKSLRNENDLRVKFEEILFRWFRGRL